MGKERSSEVSASPVQVAVWALLSLLLCCRGGADRNACLDWEAVIGAVYCLDAFSRRPSYSVRPADLVGRFSLA